jgi:ABC-type glutathione transport system ATPase component
MTRQDTKPILEIRDLTVKYATGPEVLRDAQLIMRPGEAVGIYGASGCGKTTLARAIPGLLPPACSMSGLIRFDGQDVLRMTSISLRAVRGARVASLFQEPSLSLSPHLRIGSQIGEVIAAHRGLRNIELRAATMEFLQPLFGEESSRTALAYPHELSGGQRQRAAIARALCCKPELVVADEPTASLDSIGQRDVLGLLARYREQTGMSMILISHNRTVLARNTGRMFELRDGRLQPA